jgi:hypothetical protein
MAKLRAEFHFAVNDLLVAREALGATVEFERNGYRVRVKFPAHDKEFFPRWNDIESIAIGGDWSGVVGDPRQRVNVLIVQVAVFGEGPVSAKDFEGAPEARPTSRAIEYFQKTFLVAQAVCAELIDWARVRGQVWLGLHGQHPERIGIDSLIDDDTDRRLPVGFHTLEVRESPPESAIDPAFISSLDQLLNDGRPPLPIAETFLADALHFAWARLADLQRAVLLAAIACEVKVKRVLRDKTTPGILPMLDVLLENPRDWSLAAAALFDKAMRAALGHSLKDEHRDLFKRIDNLFRLRNGIAHRGQRPSSPEANEAVAAARKVFEWLDALPTSLSIQPVAKQSDNEGDEVIDQRIRLRAYDLYLQRGGQPGSALDDWLLAEDEIRATA